MTLRLLRFALIVRFVVCLVALAALAKHFVAHAASYQADAPQPASPDGRIEGFGTDIPLSLALEQIIPSGLAVAISPSVRKDMKVSWHGDGDWRGVLQRLAKANHLTVSFVGRSVLIGAQSARAQPPSPSTRPVATAVQPLSPIVLHPAQPVAHTTGQRPIAAATATPISTAPSGGNGVWHAAQGETLDQVLNDWAEISGWTVVFNSQMVYDLQASADFRGDFLQAASALVESIQAKPQPLATFYRGNRALVISNSVDQIN